MEYGRYQTIDKLGQGAMGVVYKAFDPQINRELALKILRDDRMSSEYYVQRFLKEAVAIGRLSHPNIVTVYDAGEDHGTIFIAMELLEGAPLNDIVRHKTISLKESLTYCIQVAKALDYAHKKGIVHRDVKTTNIIISTDNQVKITDFGIAHIEDPQLTLQTQAGEILGTPAYMSPEQVTGQPVDGRSDLFSLGVILYELTTRKRPFTGAHIGAIFKAITQDEPDRPDKLDRNFPKDLADTIMKSLSKKPEDRFQSGTEMAKAIEQCLNHLEEPEPEAKVQRFGVEVTKVTVGKPKWLIYAIIAIIVLGGGGLIWYWVSTSNSGKHTDITGPVKPVKPADISKISVATDPAGAYLYLDGGFKGKTPVDVETKFGRHEIRITLEGYFDQEFQLTIDKPQITLSRRLISIE